MSKPEVVRPHNVTLNRYARTRPVALWQGSQLTGYVAEQGAWLDEVRPGVRERYGRGLARAASNVRRIGKEQDENFQAYVVSDNRVLRAAQALGTATIIADQRIQHPALPDKQLVVTDIDYSLSESLAANDAVHGGVAGALLQFAVQITLPPPEKVSASPDTVFLAQPVATVVDGQPNPSHGFQQIMKPFGEPGVLQMPGDDEYGTTKGGLPVQLYVSEADHHLLTRQ